MKITFLFYDGKYKCFFVSELSFRLEFLKTGKTALSLTMP